MALLSPPFDMSKYVEYTKTVQKDFPTLYTIAGLELTKGSVHRSIGVNQFDATPTKIPKGFAKRRKKLSAKHLKSWVYDPSRPRLRKTEAAVIAQLKKYKTWKAYFTHNNGGRPFLVYIKGSSVAIFAFPDKTGQPFVADVDQGTRDQKWHYCVPVATYTNVQKTWIGKSPKTRMTEFSGGHGPAFTGNSILLQVSPQKYVHVGASVSEFQTRDPIVEYWSPVGNNDVPYPVAIGSKYAYFMLDRIQVPLTSFSRTLTAKDKKDLYFVFYGHDWEDEETGLLPKDAKSRNEKEFARSATLYSPTW